MWNGDKIQFKVFELRFRIYLSEAITIICHLLHSHSSRLNTLGFGRLESLLHKIMSGKRYHDASIARSSKRNSYKMNL